MKKVLFVQVSWKSYGGIWQVNKVVAEELVKHGYDVSFAFIRQNKTDYEPEYDKRIKINVINPNLEWMTHSYRDIIKSKSIDKLKVRINHDRNLKKDKKVFQKLIRDNNYDYIITTQYELLDLIPKEYLSHVFHEQHTSFENSWSHRGTKDTLLRYNNKINFIWLSKKTMEDALDKGLNNCYYLYNPLRFESKEKSKVNNKRLVTISRLSKQKRLDKMINFCEEIFKDKKYKDWVLEIYGDGLQEDNLKKLIHNHDQVKLMGRVDDPIKILLKSDINLNTSDSEGFPMSILEACECGIPTVSLIFGESVYETIIDRETGFICKDKEEFIKRVKELMDDNKLLKEFSDYNVAFASKFKPDIVVKKWIKMFQVIDNRK